MTGTIPAIVHKPLILFSPDDFNTFDALTDCAGQIRGGVIGKNHFVVHACSLLQQ